MRQQANGIGIDYTITGDGPWLVMSHSLACASAMWAPQVAAFSDRYRVLCFDTRGHGATDAPAGAYWMELDLDSRVATWRRAPYDPAPCRARATAAGLVPLTAKRS